MQIILNTKVYMSFLSKSKKNIDYIFDSSSKSGSFAELIRNISGNKEFRLLFDGTYRFITINTYYHNQEEYWALQLEADFGSLHNPLFISKVKEELKEKFKEEPVSLVYLDHAARVNSDKEGIVYTDRFRIEYDVNNRYGLLIEKYSTVEELLKSNLFKLLKINSFDPEYSEDIEEFYYKASQYTPLFYIRFIYYTYDYPSFYDNINIAKFKDLLLD